MTDLITKLEVRRSLVNQIFELTGIPVDVDDPLVVAALLQSAYMQTAANRAAADIRREAEALAETAEKFAELARRIESKSSDRSAEISALTQWVTGIAQDLRETPAYPGWMSNIALVFAGSIGGASLVLSVGKLFGWLH